MIIIKYLYLNLLIYCLFVLLLAFNKNRRKLAYFSALLLFFITLLFNQALIIGIDPMGLRWASYLAFINWLSNQSQAFYLIVFILVLSLASLITYKEEVFSRGSISRSSIKEAMDKLPMGICFSTDTGLVLLSNKTMEVLSQRIFGKNLQNAQHLWNKLQEGKGQGKEEKNPFLVLVDQKSWLFSRDEIRIDGHLIYEIGAIDISEENILRIQLEEKNKDFARMNRRLHRYNQELVDLKTGEERLATKARIHNELGYMLLLASRQLKDGASKEDKKSILASWKEKVNLILKGQELRKTNVFEELETSAEQIGLKFKLEGQPPREEHLRDLSLKVAMEAVNNAVRHAGATELILLIEEEKDLYRLELTNNGTLPDGDISEGGGLSILRDKVELLGGQMDVEMDTGFSLKINLVKRGGN